MELFTIYLRVSTFEQGQSGLGLAAQENACREYASRVGGSVDLVFTEIASGGDNERPVLAACVAHCNKTKSRLLVMKLDRLARSVGKIDSLQKTVDFLALDAPTGDFLQTGVLSLMGEYERKIIGQRTSAALQALAATGKRLGWSNPNRTDGDRARSNALAVRQGKAGAHAARLGTTIKGFQLQGIVSMAAIATALNEAGQRTIRGKYFKAMTVSRVLQKLEGC